MKKRQSGVALIELALVLPLLLAICFAITEFGRAIYSYNTLAKSARDAVRYLSTYAVDDLTAQGIAKNLAVYGNPSGTGSPLLPGLTQSQVQITNNNLGTPSISTVTLTISGYQFTPILDLLQFTRFYTGGTNTITSITFGNISVTMRQYSS